MKLFQKLAMSLCLFVGIVCADDASYNKTFQKFLEVSQSNALINEIQNGTMLNDMLQNVYAQAGDKITQDQKTQVANIMKETLTNMIDEAMPQLVAIYKQYFTESDLKEFIKFYESPIGQKLSQNMIPIQKDTQGMLTQIMLKHIPIMEQKLGIIAK